MDQTKKSKDKKETGGAAKPKEAVEKPKEAVEKPNEPVEKPNEKDALVIAAARVIGSVAGTVAHTMGVHGEAAAHPRHGNRPKGKLQPKNKARMPRRQKKAMKKRAAS